jgi:hypothetical protein
LKGEVNGVDFFFWLWENIFEGRRLNLWLSIWWNEPWEPDSLVKNSNI